MKVVLVVGARPNFMKAMPLIRELRLRGDHPVLVHTGQHYDWKMSGAVLADLEMPEPDINLNLGNLARSEMVMRATFGLRKVLKAERPDWTIVVGDVNSTLSGALAAAKEGIPVAHVEAGLRSGDERMPEEFNRKQVDALSDLLFTTSQEASENLKADGALGRIHLVGNTMIDTLVWALPKIRVRAEAVDPGTFGVVTLHRPELVDYADALALTIVELDRLSDRIPLRFSVHPRTRKRIFDLGLKHRFKLLDPLPYLDFMALVSRAAFVLTDSGGVQEETSFLGVPCLTLRDSTERPETIRLGTNRLVQLAGLPQAIESVLTEPRRTPPEIPFWDGRAAERIVKILHAGGYAN